MSRSLFPLAVIGVLVMPSIPVTITNLVDSSSSLSPTAIGQLTDRISENKLLSEELSDLAAESDCIQVIYGWAAGASYISALKPPCSPYFLLNIILGSPDALAEYQSKIRESPPSLVVYSPDGADLPVTEFESVVFPWQDVVGTCYRSTGLPNVFAGKGSKAELAACVSEVFQ
jgi:hypothetical protein